MKELILIANFDVAGQNKFISHAVKDDKQTYCGLYRKYLRGQWERIINDEPGGEKITKPGCLKCQRAIKAADAAEA